MNNTLNFCETCNELTEQTVCPKCGKPTREPQDGDMCFVQELGGMNVDMYVDALNNNDIKFVHTPKFGGASWYNTPTSYKFYVRYADYDQAVEILYMLFGGQDENEELDDHDLIDRIVKVTIDRPRGSVHPEHPDIIYEVDYGHVEGVMGGDGEEQDAYLLDFSMPEYLYVGKEIDGFIVAVIRRKNDVETKWVVSADGSKKYTREEIEKAVRFQEQYFDIEIIM